LQRLACLRHVAEGSPLAVNVLIVFVPFTCDQHHISRRSVVYGKRNRLGTVPLDSHDALITDTTRDMPDDLVSVLRARIVVSNNKVPGIALCHFSHHRSLTLVAIATTTKHTPDVADK